MSGAEEHQKALMAAFAGVIRAEQAISDAEAELYEATNRLKRQIAEQETAKQAAWAEVRDLMGETGEVEVILPGATTDYRIGWSAPAESVLVPDAEAVPEEYVKREPKPKKAEIARHLKALRKAGKPWPNWASLETGSSRLVWAPVKKGSA